MKELDIINNHGKFGGFIKVGNRPMPYFINTQGIKLIISDVDGWFDIDEIVKQDNNLKYIIYHAEPEIVRCYG